MPDWYRVRDEKTGHEYNSPFLADGLEEVGGETHDVYGNAIPPVYGEQKSLEDLTVPELKEKAEQSGVDLAGAKTKAEIVAQISEGAQK